MSATPDPVSPGDLIGGKYRVERVLGRGGMGVVVAATHADLGQRVAIKFLLKEAMDSDGVAARFLREGRTMVQLTSEHVARVTDVGTHENGAPYLVMEYLEGQDLGAVLETRGPLPPSEVVDYLLQACEAVAEAHARQVVHRDLKPGNLFLTRRPDGSPFVKVLDFGISKATEPSGNKLTVTAAVMGSPAYMSPEQVRSTSSVDHRSDVWSLGVIAYELLSGKLPFEAPSMSGMFAAIVASPMVPLATRRPGLPPELLRAVERALVKDVDGRFRSVAEFASALAPFGGDGARISAARVTRQLGASGVAFATATTGGSVSAVSERSATSTTGPHVATGSSGASRGLALVLGALVLVVSAAGAGAYLMQQRTASTPTASAEPAVRPEPPTPVEVTTPAPAATPTVSVALVTAPSASAVASVTPPPAAKPARAPVTRAPKPARSPPAPPTTTTQPPPAKPKFDPLGGSTLLPR